jgi:hypothetical protein
MTLSLILSSSPRSLDTKWKKGADAAVGGHSVDRSILHCSADLTGGTGRGWGAIEFRLARTTGTNPELFVILALSKWILIICKKKLKYTVSNALRISLVHWQSLVFQHSSGRSRSWPEKKEFWTGKLTVKNPGLDAAASSGFVRALGFISLLGIIHFIKFYTHIPSWKTVTGTNREPRDRSPNRGFLQAWEKKDSCFLRVISVTLLLSLWFGDMKIEEEHPRLRTASEYLYVLEDCYSGWGGSRISPLCILLVLYIPINFGET